MLFSCAKALALLVMPCGLIWLAIMAAAWCWARRRRWLPAALCLGLAVLYACAGNVYLGGALLSRLERQVAPPVTVDAALRPFDAVFVLGGGSQQDRSGGPELDTAGDRLFLAARLWHAGKAKRLVASGVSRDGVDGFRDGGQETRALWRSVGIPDSAILVLPEPCWNTRDEIRAYRRLLQQHPELDGRRLGLVSSASHLPRALALARREGLTFTPLGADWRGRRHPFQLQSLVPQGAGFLDVQRACWEYLGRFLGL